MKKNIKRITRYSLFIFTSLIIIIACQNQDKEVYKEIDEQGLSINEAKRLFDSKYTNVKQRDSFKKQKKTPYDESLDNRKIKWEKAYNRKLSHGESVLAPIDFGKILFKFKNKEAPTYLPYNYLNYAYMYKDSAKELHTEWVTLEPDSTWFSGTKSTYTGTILVRNWEGDFLKIYKYVDGKQTEALNVVENTANGRTNVQYVYDVCIAMNNPNCPAQVTTPPTGNEDPDRCIIDVCRTIFVDTENPTPVGGTGGSGGTGSNNNGGGPGGGSGSSGGGGDYVPECNPNVPAGTYPSNNALPGCWMWAATPIFDPNSFVLYRSAFEKEEGISNQQAGDWDNTEVLYPRQNKPAWSSMYGINGYPRQLFTGHPTWDKTNNDVYTQAGGDILNMALAEPAKYANACALRVSIALNKSGITIPSKLNRTYKGKDGKYYFLSAAKLYKFCLDTFGKPTVIIKPTSTNGNVDYINYLKGKKGIYIMRAANPSEFDAEGHATLFDGNDAIRHSNGSDAKHFDAGGGIWRIYLWELP